MSVKIDLLAEALAEAISTFHNSTSPTAEADLQAATAAAFEDAGILFPVETTAAMTAYMTKNEEWADQYRDWSVGTATGGPNSDGLYPISDRSGVVRLIPSPAKIQASVSSQTDTNTANIGTIMSTMLVAADLEPLAPKESPAFTGTPTAPTPSANANNTIVPTTAWVNARIATATNDLNTAIANFNDDIADLFTALGGKADQAGMNARVTALENIIPTLAPIASPAFTGTPTTTKPPAASNNGRVPTTAWVRELLGAQGLAGGFNLPNAAVVTDHAYGAKGDGSADDTAAFAAAFASGRKVIIVPPGVYMVSATLNVPSDRTIIGYGVVSRIMLVPAVTNNTNIIAATNKERINVMDIVLDGNRLNQPASNHTTCLQFSNVTDAVLDNVHGVGSLIDGLYLYSCNRLIVNNCKGYDNGYAGVDASGMNIDTCKGATINNYQGYNNGFHGLYVSAAEDTSFNNIVVHDNSHDGIRAVWGVANCNFNNINSYGNGWRGVMFSNGCYSINMSNLNIHDNSRHGLAGSELWGLSITNAFINSNAWSGIATSEAGDEINAINAFLGGNAGGPTEVAAGSYINLLNP